MIGKASNELLETLRNNLNLGALAVTVAACAVLVIAVAIIARRTEGRPVRDTLALIGSGIILILLTIPIAIAFSGHEVSPEVGWLLRQLEYVLFFSLAYLVWWVGNKASHRLRARKSRRAKSFTGAAHPR